MMQKLLSVVLLGICLVFTGSASASMSSYVYTLDINIPDPGMITPIESRIGGLEFSVLGGSYGMDWVPVLGNAVPQGIGNWVFENFGTWNTVYDDYDWSAPDFAPLQSGNVLTITSGVELSFLNIGFYDFGGKPVNEPYFITEGFTRSVVPVPGSVILLFSGALGVLSIRRRTE